VLRPGELVPAEADVRAAELLADEVAPAVGHVGVADAEDERDLGADAVQVVEGVGAVWGGRCGRYVWSGVGAEGAGVDVCWEVGCCCGYAGVELGGS
jgi:hypothetical protein